MEFDRGKVDKNRIEMIQFKKLKETLAAQYSWSLEQAAALKSKNGTRTYYTPLTIFSRRKKCQ